MNSGPSVDRSSRRERDAADEPDAQASFWTQTPIEQLRRSRKTSNDAKARRGECCETLDASAAADWPAADRGRPETDLRETSAASDEGGVPGVAKLLTSKILLVQQSARSYGI
ncbi:hypothetical protein Dda_8832 [Drechslerella dactyloides]|uniref:Uncharacterized protein n=1 Tax=Drechslerella dactyloides TaxID=74499 RepID=A0AAD6IQ36_DREDA|nr:hypothetical protein Dda_8832 [Drechslerella dactyloides]